MNWFNRKTTRPNYGKRQTQLAVEELESRLTTGNFWSPSGSIGVYGIEQEASEAAPAIMVAGSVIDFWILGSGDDFDAKINSESGSLQWVEDDVDIVWCNGLETKHGAQVTFQLGTAGSPGDFTITLDADDAAAIPAGDFGSRDDTAVHFDTHFKAIWATISGKFGGPMDSDNDSLTFADDINFIDQNTTTQLGITDPTNPNSGEAFGYFYKVELTATVSPSVPDGTGEFEWEQMRHIETCRLPWIAGSNGVWGFEHIDVGSWDNPSVSDGPGEGYYTSETKNDKVFMIDPPGWETGADNDINLEPQNSAPWEKVYFYGNFHTRLSFNHDEVAWPYDRHVVIKLKSADVGGRAQWTLESTPNAGPGLVQAPENCNVT